jgi:hypothetical protein
MASLIRNQSYRRSRRKVWLLCIALGIWAVAGIVHGLAQLVSKLQHLPSVKLVLAATSEDDLQWTANLTIPNLQVIPYIADNSSAPFRPPANKGHEALMYLTYLHDFYDDLPDISIFTHATDYAWHIDPIHDHSTVNALNQLDLHEVRRRKYMNLHVDWTRGCPAWINTTKGHYSRLKLEEPFMARAFAENFPNNNIPKAFAQPCCSQFAVTKEAIRYVPRIQYGKHIEWLMDTEFDDHISGRVWEHMWQWLFLRRAVDCPVEYRALCRGWHVCFGTQEQMNGWNEMYRVRELKQEEKRTLLESGDEHLQRIGKLGAEIEALDSELERLKTDAVQRGKSTTYRKHIAQDMVP